MNPPTSILAATDLSAPARHAADRAARLAHETGAAVALIHVLPGGALQDLRQWLGAGSAVAVQLLGDATQRLEALATDLRHSRRVPVQAVCVSGSVLDEIESEAERRQAQLLVMGARGEGFLRRLVLGTTSERLLRRTSRPVLVVRQTPHEAYRRALVAIDFSAWSTQSVALARCVAPRAHLVLFHACQVPFEGKLHFAGVDATTIEHYRRRSRDEATRKLHALAHAADLKPGAWTLCVSEGDASQRLVEQEQEHDCDLLVLGKHGQSVAEDLLLGSVTKHVLAESAADVLVSTGH